MAKKKTIEHVLPLGGTGWMVKNSEAKDFTAITDSKKEAIAIAREIAKSKGGILIVHAKDGSIKTKESFPS
jgi:ribosomal protein L32E